MESLETRQQALNDYLASVRADITNQMEEMGVATGSMSEELFLDYAKNLDDKVKSLMIEADPRFEEFLKANNISEEEWNAATDEVKAAYATDLDEYKEANPEQDEPKQDEPKQPDEYELMAEEDLQEINKASAPMVEDNIAALEDATKDLDLFAKNEDGTYKYEEMSEIGSFFDNLTDEKDKKRDDYKASAQDAIFLETFNQLSIQPGLNNLNKEAILHNFLNLARDNAQSLAVQLIMTQQIENSVKGKDSAGKPTINQLKPADRERLEQGAAAILNKTINGEIKPKISETSFCTTMANVSNKAKAFADKLKQKTGVDKLQAKVKAFDSKMEKRFGKKYTFIKNLTLNAAKMGAIGVVAGPVGITAYLAYKNVKTIRTSVKKFREEKAEKIKKGEKAPKNWFAYLGHHPGEAASLVASVAGTVVTAYAGIDVSNFASSFGLSGHALQGNLGDTLNAMKESMFSSNGAPSSFNLKESAQGFWNGVKNKALDPNTWIRTGSSLGAGITNSMETFIKEGKTAEGRKKAWGQLAGGFIGAAVTLGMAGAIKGMQPGGETDLDNNAAGAGGEHLSNEPKTDILGRTTVDGQEVSTPDHPILYEGYDMQSDDKQIDFLFKANTPDLANYDDICDKLGIPRTSAAGLAEMYENGKFSPEQLKILDTHVQENVSLDSDGNPHLVKGTKLWEFYNDKSNQPTPVLEDTVPNEGPNDVPDNTPNKANGDYVDTVEQTSTDNLLGKEIEALRSSVFQITDGDGNTYYGQLDEHGNMVTTDNEKMQILTAEKGFNLIYAQVDANGDFVCEETLGGQNQVVIGRNGSLNINGQAYYDILRGDGSQYSENAIRTIAGTTNGDVITSTEASIEETDANGETVQSYNGQEETITKGNGRVVTTSKESIVDENGNETIEDNKFVERRNGSSKLNRVIEDENGEKTIFRVKENASGDQRIVMKTNDIKIVGTFDDDGSSEFKLQAGKHTFELDNNIDGSRDIRIDDYYLTQDANGEVLESFKMVDGQRVPMSEEDIQKALLQTKGIENAKTMFGERRFEINEDTDQGTFLNMSEDIKGILDGKHPTPPVVENVNQPTLEQPEDAGLPEPTSALENEPKIEENAPKAEPATPEPAPAEPTPEQQMEQLKAEKINEAIAKGYTKEQAEDLADKAMKQLTPENREQLIHESVQSSFERQSENEYALNDALKIYRRDDGSYILAGGPNHEKVIMEIEAGAKCEMVPVGDNQFIPRNLLMREEMMTKEFMEMNNNFKTMTPHQQEVFLERLEGIGLQRDENGGLVPSEEMNAISAAEAAKNAEIEAALQKQIQGALDKGDKESMKIQEKELAKLDKDSEREISKQIKSENRKFFSQLRQGKNPKIEPIEIPDDKPLKPLPEGKTVTFDRVVDKMRSNKIRA